MHKLASYFGQAVYDMKIDKSLIDEINIKQNCLFDEVLVSINEQKLLLTNPFSCLQQKSMGDENWES